MFWNEKRVTSLTALFGSTYLCESAFSHMKIIKSKFRSTMTDHNFEVCLRLDSADMHPWLIPVSASHQSKVMTTKKKVSWNMGSCSYVRYTNVYCTCKELPVYLWINIFCIVCGEFWLGHFISSSHVKKCESKLFVGVSVKRCVFQCGPEINLSGCNLPLPSRIGRR